MLNMIEMCEGRTGEAAGSRSAVMCHVCFALYEIGISYALFRYYVIPSPFASPVSVSHVINAVET